MLLSRNALAIADFSYWPLAVAAVWPGQVRFLAHTSGALMT
jgi:hypothetical protein